MVVAAGALLALGGCGSTETSRAATSGVGGAAAGGVVGGPVGAVIGGVGGAAAGSTLDEGVDTKASRALNSGSGSGSTTSSAGAQHSTAGRSTTAARAPSPERVRAVQQALNDHNSGEDIAVDGKWGPNTRRALREFQQNNGLPQTGRLDSRTTAALNMNSPNMGSGQSGTNATPDTNAGQSGGQPQ